MVDVWETCVKMSTISCHAMIGFECTIGVWVDWEIWGGVCYEGNHVWVMLFEGKLL